MTGKLPDAPYGLMADIHLHNWNAFAKFDENGVSDRLMMLLSEMDRCCEVVENLGGDTVYIAGDLFHVRGNVKPVVFNLALDFFRAHGDFKFVIIAGNHDIETKDITYDHVSSIYALGELENVTVIGTNYPYFDDRVIMIPWVEDITIDFLKEQIEKLDLFAVETDKLDLILHAPIEGTFDNLNVSGLDPEELKKLNVKRVFAGHFHNYKEFSNKVYSIGSIAQHNFGESKNFTGFLTVYPEAVVRCPSKAPQFIDVNLSELCSCLVSGNYLKVRIDKPMSEEKILKLKDKLLKHNAKGVIIQLVKNSIERPTTSVEAGASLEVSVSDYIKSLSKTPEGLVDNCLRLLSESGEAV